MKNIIIKRSLQSILGCLCIVWIVLAIIYISGIKEPALINWIIMVMMIMDSLFFALFAYLVDKGKITVYIILIIFLFINTILTITDQIGIFDWIVLFMNLASMIPAIFLMRRLIRGTTKSF